MGSPPDGAAAKEAASLLTVLVLSDGDSVAAEASERSAARLADEVLVLERAVVDWSDAAVTRAAIATVGSDWILVLSAGEQLGVANVQRARALLEESESEAIGMHVGLGTEVRLHRANESALDAIGTQPAEVWREVSIAPASPPLRDDAPAVTVVVLTFNRPVLLRRCLESLCVQTTNDFDVIVVNDAGIDVSGIVADFSEVLRVLLVNRPHNGGAAETANTGLRLARGSCVNFQADDDTIQPHHLALLLAALADARADGSAVGMVFGPAFLVQETEDGEDISREVIFQEGHSAEKLLWQNFIVGGAALFDRALAQEIGGMNTDFEVLEDWEFWIRMAERAEIRYVETPTAEYRIREGTSNVTTQARPNFYSNLLRLYEAHPVDAESPVAAQREEQIRLQALSHKEAHAWDHTVAVIGDGDLAELAECLQSVIAALPGASFQLIIHELRSPQAEELLADVTQDATVCFHANYDEALVRRRIGRQAGGRCVTLLHSSERLSPNNLAATMGHVLDPPSNLVALPPVPFDTQSIRLDFPAETEVRYGYGKPVHSRIAAILGQSRATYKSVLDQVVGELERLTQIPLEAPDSPVEPYWNNGVFMGLDAAVLYTLIAIERPRQYLEIGSGSSTRFARRSVIDHSLDTRITSIDAEPPAECDLLCDTLVRSSLQDASLDVFDTIEAGDIVFFDGSHRSSMNSDVNAFFLDVLPGLPAGTLVHLNGIFWPSDYPAIWAERFYSAQYLLGVRLLTADSGLDIVLPATYVLNDADLIARTAPLWRHPTMAGARAGWGSFWFRTG